MATHSRNKSGMRPPSISAAARDDPNNPAAEAAATGDDEVGAAAARNPQSKRNRRDKSTEGSHGETYATRCTPTAVALMPEPRVTTKEKPQGGEAALVDGLGDEEVEVGEGGEAGIGDGGQEG